MNKSQFTKAIYPAEEQEASTYRAIDFTTRYMNKYYNLFQGLIKWKVSDDVLTPKGINYLMRKFWADGSVAAWRIPNTDALGLAPYATQAYDMWDFPSRITLINKRGISNQIIPNKLMSVDKDVVIGYFQANHKGISLTVRDYAEQLSDIDNVMNTNLQLQKAPFIILCDDEKQAKRMRNVIAKILSNNLAVEIPSGDKNSLVINPLEAPLIIDKLYEYRTNVENEIKCFLGLDNSGGYEKKERMITDEVNSQRATIADSRFNFTQCLDAFCSDVKKVLGIEISYEWNAQEKEDNSNADN